MALTRIFALIIGVDNYKSGNIWNLHACVEDARKIYQWLTDAFDVPKDQICLLLDDRATKNNIENSFMEHLVNNPGIETGDAILIYFAGHGSSMLAPSDWYQAGMRSQMVEVLCPYDHDTKLTQGRVAGISDRSFHGMIQDLAARKGNNITVMLDCCFSPNQTPANILDRSITRWTKTSKALPDDLYRGLWPAARGWSARSTLGFSQPMNTHISLLASSSGQKSVESKHGGQFTTSFLHAMSDLPLHRTSYAQLIEYIRRLNEEAQKSICVGQRQDRILFDEVPFLPDNRFLPANTEEESGLITVNAGSIHGLVKGTELSLHLHNYHYSRNPPFATIIVSDVQTSWCLARFKSRPSNLPTLCWAKVTKWNTRTPFRIYIKSSFISFIRTWRLRKAIPTSAKLDKGPQNGLNVIRVKAPSLADISLSVGLKGFSVTQHTPEILQSNNCLANTNGAKRLNEVIHNAVCFNLHLLRNNPEQPFCNLIKMEIWRIDPTSWSKVGGNHFQDGVAQIPREDGAIYRVNLYNNSEINIWPSILYMEPSRYTISTIFSSALCKSPPLPSGGNLEIGSGETGSEALLFPTNDQSSVGFLKLFFASAPVSMTMLGQGSTSQWREIYRSTTPQSFVSSKAGPIVWDSALVPLVFVERPKETSPISPLG